MGRVKKGQISIAEIARRMGTCRRQVLRIRRTPQRISLGNLLKYASAVGKSDAELYAELVRNGASKLS